MLAIDRQRRILELIEVGGSVRTVEMAGVLEVTEETIRRDFEKLEQEGHLTRAHGGAVKPEFGHRWQDIPFGERHKFQVAEKASMAQAAVEEIKEGQVLFLDASSTVLHIARNLPDLPLTVLTHALQVLWRLRDRTNLSVISTGGRLDLRSASFLGPIADEAIANCHIDLFFFSCTGIDFDRGLSDPNDFQAAFKRRVMQAADRSICLADHTKLGLRSAFFFAAPDEPDLLITDRAADAKAIAKLRSHGGRVCVAG